MMTKPEWKKLHQTLRGIHRDFAAMQCTYEGNTKKQQRSAVEQACRGYIEQALFYIRRKDEAYYLLTGANYSTAHGQTSLLNDFKTLSLFQSELSAYLLKVQSKAQEIDSRTP